MGVRGVGVAAVLCLVASAIAAAPASAGTYSNTTPILDPNSGMLGAQSLAPYPSTISVSGEAGTITKATVTLADVYGGEEPTLDVLLVGPAGSTILISDICSTPSGFASSYVHFNLTFDDDAASPLPDACTPANFPASGTWKPTNYDTSDNFPGIAPPYPLGLANVRGTSPNGDWSLYAVDDSYPDSVTINGGWTLELTTTGAPATTTPLVTQPRRKKCKHRKRHSASVAKKKRCKKKRR